MSEKNRRTPNNVRQIGQVPPHQKIYIEDYVMTFLKHMALEPDSTGVGVLLGEMRQNGNMTVLYVSGVVRMPESLPAEGTTFSGESWEKVYEDIKKYFKDVEILGWVVGQADLEGKLSEKIVKIHRKQFSGKNKLLLLYDYIEKEETIFLSDGNHLKKQSGYFVYYEKNEEMKEYMIEQKVSQSPAEQFEDRVVKDARRIMAQRGEKLATKQQYVRNAGIMAAAAFAIIIGVKALNNADQLQKMEDSLHTLTQSVEEEGAQKSGDGKKEQTEVVEVMGKNNGEDGKNGEGQNGKENSGEQLPEVTATPAPSASEIPSWTEQQETNPTPTASPTAVPKTSEANKTYEDSEETFSEGNSFYIVKEGDTLSEISYGLYGTMFKVDTIMKANDIQDANRIYPGQKLIIP